jgi:ERCC4-type nuclease
VIFADPRVGSKQTEKRSHDLTGPLSDLGIDVELTPLDFGDFAFFGNGPEGPLSVGIELKTVSDFINSMLSGRLAGHQIPGLVEKYQRVYLIIEGFYRAKRGSGLLEVPRGAGWAPLHCGPRPVFWADVERFITGLEEAGIRVRRTRTSNETARVIAQVLYGFWQKDYEEHRSFNVLYRPAPLALVRENEATRRVRQVAACLPGVGWKRSKAIAQRFRSIYGIVTAPPEAWEHLDGIGKTIAGDVQKAIREEIESSGDVPAPRSRTGPRVSARRGVGARSVRRARPRAHR